MLFGGKHIYIKIDFEYLFDIHDRDDNYLLVVEAMKVTENMQFQIHLKKIKKYHKR